MLNAAALVSGDGAELQALLDSLFFGEIPGFTLAAVIATKRGSFALTRAEGAHVPGYVVEEDIFPNGSSFSLALLNKLRDLDIDFVILAGFAPKLSEGLARAYRGRMLGLRSSALPRLRRREGARALPGPRWSAASNGPAQRSTRPRSPARSATSSCRNPSASSRATGRRISTAGSSRPPAPCWSRPSRPKQNNPAPASDRLTRAFSRVNIHTTRM